MAENVFAGVFATLVKPIHVELSDERVDVLVPEVFGEDVFLELIDLFDGELASVGHPMYDDFVLFVLKDVKAFLDEVGDQIICIFT